MPTRDAAASEGSPEARGHDAHGHAGDDFRHSYTKDKALLVRRLAHAAGAPGKPVGPGGPAIHPLAPGQQQPRALAHPRAECRQRGARG